MNELRLPKISSLTVQGQLEEIKSYLYQMVKSANYNFNSLNEDIEGIPVTTPTTESTFNPTSLLDNIYPVGSIYMSTNDVSPQEFLGGMWERIRDTFLLAAGYTYSADSTGGSANVTLTESQIPSHVHEEQLHVQNIGTVTFRGGSAVSTNTYEISSTGARGSNGTGDLVTTKTSGGGQAHDNMPPYLTVYMWKRTA